TFRRMSFPAPGPIHPSGSFGAAGHSEAPLFSDGLGDRVVSADPTTGELVQILRVNPALTAVPSFEFALRERVARLANFRHGYYARVRRVDRAQSQSSALALVSDHVEGTRLSEILRVAEERGLQLDINAALCLIRQLVPALVLLHENARDAAHGLVGPERLLVTANGRLVIAEHVCGAAIEQMQYGRERLWHEFRVAMPPSAGIPRFDQRADVTGIGVVALSLILGRQLRDDEFPRKLADLLAEATERTALGDEQPLSAPLRSWLARALQVDVRRAFASAPEALAALEEISAENSTYVAAPVALETFLSRYISAVLAPAPIAAPAPVAVAPAAALVQPGPVVVSPVAPAPAPVVAHQQVPAAVQPSLGPDVKELSELLGINETQDVETALFNPAEPFSVPELAVAPPAAPQKRGVKKWIAAAAAVVILSSAGVASYKMLGREAAPAMATLSVQSNPAGVPVFVDGIERGITPARITLAPGAHILELRRGVPRVIPVTLTAGADVSQYLEFAEAPATSEVVAPAATPEPAPAAAAAPAATGAPLAGWISAKLPFTVEIREKGNLLGTTDADRLMLASGTHQLQFVNESLGYDETRSVQVVAGRVTPISLALPKGTVNLNASPWAEVWLDGVRVGETPIGNLSVAIGSHEIIFRHPQFGEKRHAVSVTAGVPVRISVEMK
ncbi:MAG TPA: PEGA domain-containing protein, partial [Vicinamibacterales bacterium]|nr:PEGA domain-containing protein [Vicinamibacterales bacterium]